MAVSSIVVEDANGVDRSVKTRLRGSDHTQVFEPETNTPYVNLDLDETGVVVLGSVAILGSWQIFNRGDVALYPKFYNKATAPTNSDTPLKVLEVLPGQPLQGEINGDDFPLGLGLRCTTGIAHNDTGAPAPNACLINLGYRAG